MQLCVDSITHNPKIIYHETSHHPKQVPVATGPKGYNEAEQNKTYSRKLKNARLQGLPPNTGNRASSKAMSRDVFPFALPFRGISDSTFVFPTQGHAPSQRNFSVNV